MKVTSPPPWPSFFTPGFTLGSATVPECSPFPLHPTWKAWFPALDAGSSLLYHTQYHTVTVPIERLAKARVAGSNPVSRSKYSAVFSQCLPLFVLHTMRTPIAFSDQSTLLHRSC